ncbi:ABC transporter ATP-binding protein [Novosphingobium sp. 9]|uniref:ABC transporter ATP-binding protein n=1 Tax=Novosphingobium sp. 9 TaxID=2025349 RepID=UPI0021B59574|nr:ABC transporter ATP-binding protein [Novosphingobium sp. 9]
MQDTVVKLKVDNVAKSFHTQPRGGGAETVNTILGGVSFDVPEGEIVSIIGESGCGKTTLLRIITGLIAQDGGEIAIDGRAVTKPGRDRGLVFQQPNLLPWRSARENVEFGLELMGKTEERLTRAERAARATQLLELVGLGHAADQLPHQLSGGMQQRIGLARALAINPQILLMDEPFSALDAQTREVLQAELLRIHAETGKTTLFVTHDLDEAIYLSNRIVVLAARPGRVRKIIPIPFSSPRPPLPELRGDATFQSIRADIWNLIRGEAVAA